MGTVSTKTVGALTIAKVSGRDSLLGVSRRQAASKRSIALRRVNKAYTFLVDSLSGKVTNSVVCISGNIRLVWLMGKFEALGPFGFYWGRRDCLGGWGVIQLLLVSLDSFSFFDRSAWGFVVWFYLRMKEGFIAISS